MIPRDGPGKLLNDLEFEVTSSDDIISVGIKVKDDSDNFFVLSILV